MTTRYRTEPRFHQRGFFASAIRHRNQWLGSAFRRWLAADAEPLAGKPVLANMDSLT